ncbi:MAG: Cof-type HAD-IIB family hydrolase [Oscillospiraceae bacterium]|nr:Cof-type HAD-IIB family hydrolase [Oscillospiraceae bacterium]
MNIKLLAIDMDGTALNSMNTLSPGNQAALERAVQAGIYVVPASGRQYTGLPPELEKVKGIRYYLCSNGAVVYDRAQKKVLHQDLMSCSLALRILAQLQQYKSASADVYIDGKAYTSTEKYQNPSQFGVDPYHVKNFLRSRTPKDSLSAFVRGGHLRPEKVFSLFLDLQECRQCWDVFSAWPELAVTKTIESTIELTNRTATKGGGLKALASLLNLSPAEVMAIGDGHNDLPMLDWAGTSVAMGNASDQVKQHASFVTDSCDSDGLAKAITRFLFS